MRVAIIGAGVSGMAAAWLLQHDHCVTLFDRAQRLGGHVETKLVHVDGHTIHAELGPRFFFDSAYPYFLTLLRVLGIRARWTDATVSFTDVAKRRTVVPPPRSLRRFASIVRDPRLIGHLLSLRHLVEDQPVVAAARDYSVTFRRHLAERGYPASFGPEFAYPFLAACWGAPLCQIPDFPVYTLLKGMPLGTRPGFYEIQGGMSRYIRALGDELTEVDLRLGATVRRIEHRDGYWLEDDGGARGRFDQLIVATSAWDAARLLHDVPSASLMVEIVGSFRHFEIEIVLHGDPSLMPPDRRDWSHNNLFVSGESTWMSDWQGLSSDVPVIRSWLPKGRELPRPLHGRRRFRHVLMTPDNGALQRRIAELQGRAGLWVTGMYTVDVDNHESALLSALVPAHALAPRARNLARWLGAVPASASHGLEVLPVPFTAGRLLAG